MDRLEGSRILMLVEEAYEDLEVWYPRLFLTGEGAEVVVAGPEAGRIYHGKHGYPCHCEVSIDDVEERDFGGLIIPGGFSPDKLRRLDKVLELTKSFHSFNKCVAHICHGGWVAISAGIVKGYQCTSSPGIKDDMVNAGARWVDESLVIDRHMVSSRRPDDLPFFCRGIHQVMTEQRR